MEGKDRPGPLGQKEYNELGKTLSLMLSMCRPIFGSVMDVVLDSVIFVPKLLQSSNPKVSMRQILPKNRC